MMRCVCVFDAMRRPCAESWPPAASFARILGLCTHVIAGVTLRVVPGGGGVCESVNPYILGPLPWQRVVGDCALDHSPFVGLEVENFGLQSYVHARDDWIVVYPRARVKTGEEPRGTCAQNCGRLRVVPVRAGTC